MFNIIEFLVNIIFTLFGIALILRAWVFAIRLHPFNPISKAVIQATNWLVMPIKKFIPTGNKIDWPSIFACWLVAVAHLLILWVLFVQSLPALQHLPYAFIAGVITMGKWAFNILLWATLIQAVLSWVNPTAPIMPVLRTITDPLLNPIRRIMPNLGGLDLSPLVLLIIAQVAIMILEQASRNLFL